MSWNIMKKDFDYGSFRVIGLSYSEPFHLIFIANDRVKARELDKNIAVRVGTGRELVEKIIERMPFAVTLQMQEEWENQIERRIEEIKSR